MSQKKQNSKPRKPIVPSDEEIADHRRRRQINLETHASAIQDYSDIDQGILRLEEQIASPEAQEDYKELQQMCLRLEENKNLLTEKMENWLELQEN